MATRYVWEKFDVVGTAPSSGGSTGGYGFQSGASRVFAYTGTMRYDATQDKILGDILLGTYNLPTDSVPFRSGGTVYVVFETERSDYKYTYFWSEWSGLTGKHFSLTTGGVGYVDSEWPNYSPSGMKRTRFTFSKGPTSQGKASSASSSAYSTGKNGGSWYVSLGSDNIDPVSLTYTDPVDAGAEIGLTITPSAGTTLGGTITYTIQTTVNGEDWYDAGTTTATTFTVTVPQDAVIWNVRVFAKDDTGFTSDTYVYGNGVDTWVTVNHIGFAPDSGSLGYLTSKNLLAVSVSHDSETTYSLEAKLDETSVFTKADCSTTTAVMITLTDEQWQAVTEEDEHTLDVTATFTSGVQTRNYTFHKFTYDDTSLAGVMAGTAKAIRIKRDYATQILGRNFPKEIIKVDNPINTNALKASTASEAQVFSGYTFFSGDSELRTGIAMSQETNVTADNIPAGITAYNKDGQFISGNGSGVFKYQKVSFYTSDNDEAGKTYTYNTDFKIYAVAFDSSNTNYGCATVTNHVGTSSLGKGIIVGDKTQMAVGYLMSGQGSIVWVITKVSDTQVTARCLGAGINGAGSTTIDLYIIGG